MYGLSLILTLSLHSKLFFIHFFYNNISLFLVSKNTHLNLKQHIK